MGSHLQQMLIISTEEVCVLDMFRCLLITILLTCLVAGPKITDPALLRKQAKELVNNWPEELIRLIDLSPDETISKTLLVDRWLWPGLSPPASTGKVVLVGDAWHPMTPNLGQGACCALEDSVILTRKLADAIKSGPTAIEGALRAYGEERWPRVFPLTVRANLVGSLPQEDSPPEIVESLLIAVPANRYSSTNSRFKNPIA